MNANKIRIIAVICLIVFCVGVFAACKKKENDEQLVSVSTDENGSLYYTDPTYEVDGIEYGGETHFVKPDETNKHGEYKIGDVTSQAYVTNESGVAVPVEDEGTTTVPSDEPTQKPTQSDSSADKTTNQNTTDKPTESPSGDKPTDPTNPTDSTQPTQTTEEPSFEGIDGVVDGNKLNNDGVIEAW